MNGKKLVFTIMMLVHTYIHTIVKNGDLLLLAYRLEKQYGPYA